MAAEMDELRSLQLQEKKVFLTNLEGMERALKEKERETDEVRARVSSLFLLACLYTGCVPEGVPLSGRGAVGGSDSSRIPAVSRGLLRRNWCCGDSRLYVRSVTR